MNLPDFQLPVPANPPDAGTLIAVQFGQDWIPAILTVLEILRDKNYWHSPPSDIIPQVDELMDRIANFMIISPQLNVRRYFVLPIPTTTISGTGMVWSSNVNQATGGFFTMLTAAQNNAWKIKLSFLKGVVTFDILAAKGVNFGILSVSMPNGDTNTFDCYNATPLYNQALAASYTIAADGDYEVTFKVLAKNATSTGYAQAISGLIMDVIF
jgi:hypothetical protein